MKVVKKTEEIKIDVFDALPSGGTVFRKAETPKGLLYMKINVLRDLRDRCNSVVLETGNTVYFEKYDRVVRVEGAFVEGFEKWKSKKEDRL